MDRQKRAAAYLRVSSERQKKEGFSIEAQELLAQEYSKSNNWILSDNLIFREDSPAAKVDGQSFESTFMNERFKDRPELCRLLDAAQRNVFKHLIIQSRDRFARSVEDMIALELFLRACKIDVHYVKEGENFDNPDPTKEEESESKSRNQINRLLHIVFTSLAEMEIDLLSTRVRDGAKACVSRGNWPGGRPPFGYVLDTAGKKTVLEKSSMESTLVTEVFNLYLLESIS